MDAPLVVIVGPTASGKSDLSLKVCHELGGEAVNCDSVQIYRHFDVGTAKLTVEQRQSIPHHLIDIAEPDELFTAGEFARRARSVLAEIRGRGRLPVVVGGTGFYLRALLDGLFQGPVRNDELRARLASRAARRPGSLHRILSRLDPAAARTVHANDTPKLIRALEVCLLTRRSLTFWYATPRDALTGFCPLKIGLSPSRDALYDRINARSERMFAAGLVDEVRHILALGYSPTIKPLESHGYHQALQVIQGELNLKEAIFYTQRNTRHYAKRQATWFRAEKGVEWFRGFGDDPALQSAVVDRVRQYLEELERRVP